MSRRHRTSLAPISNRAVNTEYSWPKGNGELPGSYLWEGPLPPRKNRAVSGSKNSSDEMRFTQITESKKQKPWTSADTERKKPPKFTSSSCYQPNKQAKKRQPLPLRSSVHGVSSQQRCAPNQAAGNNADAYWPYRLFYCPPPLLAFRHATRFFSRKNFLLFHISCDAIILHCKSQTTELFAIIMLSYCIFFFIL